MSNLINDLTISITPNAKPQWNGNIRGAVFDPAIKLINYTAPISEVSGGYSYISMDLWVDTWACKNEDIYTLSGTTYSARPLITHSDPVVICPCSDLMDEFIEDSKNENSLGYGYKEIYQETLGSTLTDLLVGTGWVVKVDSNIIQQFPVVTEANPVTVLNGSILEQLAQLLNMYTPDSLWGQSLSFFLNIFTLEILVVPPTGGNTSVTLDLDQIKPIDFNVRKEDIPEKPENVMLQEYDSALYRHESHFDYAKYNEESYNFQTSVAVDEADSDQTDIRASIKGERANIGRLVLWDTLNVIIDESRFGSVTASYGSSLLNPPTYTVSWSENKTTDVTVESSYEYILGPPYGDMSSQSTVYPGGSVGNPINRCFPSSLPGTRQQMARDIAPIKITKDSYPDILANTDGIRVSKKTVTTTECLKSVGNAPEDGQEYVTGETEQNQTIVTTVSERLAYDETGNLVTNRIKKVVTKDTGEVSITDTTIVISPISDDFYAQTMYTVRSDYDATGSIIDSTVTDISSQTVSGDQTGPQALSSFSSVSDNELLREQELSSGSAGDVYAHGTVYTGVNNLVLEEAAEYLATHYLIGPDSAFYVSFGSEFVDPRNILGGFINLTGSMLNRSKLYDMAGVELSLESTGAVNNPELYRVTGIALQWAGEKPPITAIALCRME